MGRSISVSRNAVNKRRRQPPARALDDPGGGGRQARALREAGRDVRGRGIAAARHAEQDRNPVPGSIHGAHVATVAARARDRAFRQARPAACDQRVFQLLQRGFGQRPQRRGVRRRRVAGHRVLPGEHVADVVRPRTGTGLRDDGSRPAVWRRSALLPDARFRKRPCDWNMRHAARPLPARPDSGHAGQAGNRDPVQCAAGSFLPDRGPRQRRPGRAGQRNAPHRRVRSVHDPGGPLLASRP